MRSEKRELFENDSYDVDSKIWYRHIRNLIISAKNPEETIKNLTIISFNYDRSLDYYLRTRLSNYYDKIKERKSLYSSNKIFVLGFAFHQQNCDLLQLDKLENKKEIFYTNYDDSEGIKRAVTKIFKENHQINFHPSSKKGVYNALIHDFRLDFE